MSSSCPEPALLDSLQAVIWEADPSTFQFTYVSRGAEALLGHSLEHWLSRPTFWIDLLHPEDRERAMALCKQAVADCRDDDFEYRVIAANGETRWIRDLVSVGCDGSGRATELRGLMVDIGKRKIAEAQLRADLARAQTLETVGRLAGTVAHDLNNVLCAVRGHAEVALELESVRSVRAELMEISRAADLGDTLVQQLLALGRPERTRHHVVDVSDSLGSMIGLLERLVGKSVEIELSLTAATTRVRMARGLIEQVVMNLAVNAGDAMACGGGRLRIATSIVNRQTRDHSEGVPYLELKVSDTGSGIPAEIRHQIFDPYFTTKAFGRGTGLGLAIVTAIVQDAGGEISVESEPDHGTAFRIFLPIADGRAAVGDGG
jgi:PAS domain S-box-containing protein